MNSGNGSASIILERAKGGWRDLVRSYVIVIDGEQVGKVKRGQTVELPVKPGRHEVFLKIDWCRSPALEVDLPPGDVVQLWCEPGGRASEGLRGVIGDATQAYISLTRRPPSAT